MKSCSKFQILFSGVGIGSFAFLLYAFTGARTIQWQDSAQFTYRICSGTLWNEYGLAMVHPLHFWLGRLMMSIFPGPDPWAVSLVSALGGALAVGLVFVCIFKLTGKKSAALFGAMTLMLAHSFWRFSGLPEVYTWSAALLLGEVVFYLRLRETNHPSAWWGVFFVNGLAFANHNMALLSTAVWGITFLLWAKRSSSAPARRAPPRPGVPAVEPAKEIGIHSRRRRLFSAGTAELPLPPFAELRPPISDLRFPISFFHLFPIAFFWILGALPYLLIVLLELKQRPFGEVIHSALFGEHFKNQVAGLLPAPGILLISLAFMLLSFPGFALFFAGRAVLKRIVERGRPPGRGSRSARAGAPMTAISLPLPVLFIVLLHLVFFLRYNVIDQYTFLIPVYALIALLAGVGFATLRGTSVWKKLAWGLLLLQPLMYMAVPAWARQSGVLARHERHKPYRDDYNYLFLPWQVQERSAEKLMQDAFGAIQPGGVMVVEDSMAHYTVLWTRMLLGQEEPLKVVRPAQLLEGPAPAGSVWIPARSDLPPLEGWEKKGEVWIRTRAPRGDANGG